MTKLALGVLCALALSTSALAAARPPIRIVSRPFSTARGDAMTIAVYDRPPDRRDICTMETFPGHLKAGGCWWRSHVASAGSGPAIDSDLGHAWISGLGPRGTTTAIVRVRGRRFVLHERGIWRAWVVPHALPVPVASADVSVRYR
jgi:hypothetical protein